MVYEKLARELITIVIDDNDKLYWHKNTSMYNNNLNGPYNSETELRNYTNKCINFKNVLLDTLFKKFKNKDKYIIKSNEVDIDEDVRFKYRRNIFSTLEFIGILYKKNMISEKIIHVIMIEFLNMNGKKDSINEEYIESFCILWKNVNDKIICPIHPNLLKEYVNYIAENIVPMKWSTRITFMLEDLIETYEYKTDTKINIKYENIKSNDVIKEDKEDKFEKIESIIYEFKNEHDVVGTSQNLQKYSNEFLDSILDYYCTVL